MPTVPTDCIRRHQKCDLLKTRVVIHAYNHHVRLLSPEPVVVSNQSLLGWRSRHCYAITCKARIGVANKLKQLPLARNSRVRSKLCCKRRV